MTMIEELGLADYEIYDFSRTTTLARAQARGLELAFETFTRQWGTQLTTKTRTRAVVSFDSVSVQTYDEYSATLPAQTALALFGVDASPSGGKAVIQFPARSGLGWIARMLGGANDPLEFEDDWIPQERPFTIIEQAIMRRLMEDTVDDLKYSFGAQLKGDIGFESIQHNSQFAQANGPADLMVVAEFTVAVAERIAAASVALPADAVLPGITGAAVAAARGDALELVRAQIASVPVEVGLQLSPRIVTARSVIRLAVGDIIRLPHPSHKPLHVAVEGQPIARASVGSTGSRVACVIVDTEESAR